MGRWSGMDLAADHTIVSHKKNSYDGQPRIFMWAMETSDPPIPSRCGKGMDGSDVLMTDMRKKSQQNID
jgi:hypothetical protein